MTMYVFTTNLVVAKSKSKKCLFIVYKMFLKCFKFCNGLKKREILFLEILINEGVDSEC